MVPGGLAMSSLLSCTEVLEQPPLAYLGRSLLPLHRLHESPHVCFGFCLSPATSLATETRRPFQARAQLWFQMPEGEQGSGGLVGLWPGFWDRADGVGTSCMVGDPETISETPFSAAPPATGGLLRG